MKTRMTERQTAHTNMRQESLESIQKQEKDRDRKTNTRGQTFISMKKTPQKNKQNKGAFVQMC